MKQTTSDGKKIAQSFCCQTWPNICAMAKKYLIFSMKLLHKANEKARKMKKAFCFNICSCHSLWQNVSSSDFSFSQVTSVAKKEPRGTFLSLGLRPRLQKTFPRFPFFYFGNLGKTKIVRGQIFPQSSTTNYRNKILLILIPEFD